jgi:glucose-6-phosphate 1-dehydrogenase
MTESLTLIIFGITSNLAQIKLIPALYDMEENGNMPNKLTIVGNSRKVISKKELDEYVTNVLESDNKHHKHPIKKEVLQKLLSRMHHMVGNLDDPELYPRLNNFILETDESLKQEDNRIYYLATYPELYHHVFENLQMNSMNHQEKGFVRLMIEKPIGSDLESASELNKLVLKYFDESQVYRLDHYLGKETLQNILTFRFGNSIFEPVINHEFIDHIQITASEDFGIGKRGGYFDTVGSLKDVGQNHQLQMIAFATMDAPTDLTNEAITKERIKILEKLVPIPKKVVYGQYEGYTNEENVAKDSVTDTFYAFKTFIDNSRFRDVPIYVRAGKKLKETVTEIAIVFKNPVNKLFSHLNYGDQPNVLIYRIQPNEGIVLKILTKKNGSCE